MLASNPYVGAASSLVRKFPNSMKPITALRSTAFALLAAISSVNAADFSFTGNLLNDDDVQLFNFTVGSTSTVTLRTLSYAGSDHPIYTNGTNAAGAVIPRGGFDPILALFNSAGSLIAQNDDGLGAPIDPVTSAAFDTQLQTTLGAGSYTVSVMQFSNFAIGPNLSNGFDGSNTSGFVDFTGNARTSAWAFDILNVSDAGVVIPPVPPVTAPDSGSALLLISLAFSGLIAARRTLRI